MNTDARFPLLGLRRTFATAWKENPVLTLVGLIMLGTLAASLGGLALDARVITGAPAWMKPAKFAISTAFYAFSLVWLLRFVQGRARIVRVVSFITAFCLLVEIAIIAIQVLRGITSHFNITTPLNATLWTIMGIAIVPVFLMGMLITVLLMLQKGLPPVFATSLRWGMFVTLVGMGVGYFMTGPNEAQLAALHAGQEVKAIGSHTVGAPDGGPGLPILGWSTTSGDLRVGHFVGMHALQLLPLFGGFLRRLRSLETRHQTALLHIVGCGHLGLTLLVTWQALRGQPVIAPDALTRSLFLLLLGSVALAASAVLFHGYRRESRGERGVVAGTATQ